MFDILYSNQNWAVLNKHPGYSVQEITQAHQNFHPAHRLDKETSGLWLVAFNDEYNQKLSLLFQSKQIEKTYIAITSKMPQKKQGKIVGDIVKSRRGQWKLSDTKMNPAVTRYRSLGYKDGLRLAICWPETGKTHQIRVTMKAIGSPIYGDKLYNKSASSRVDRLYLHAYALSFSMDGQIYLFECMPTVGSSFCDETLQQKLVSFFASNA